MPDNLRAFPLQPERISIENAMTEWGRYLIAIGNAPSGRRSYLSHMRRFRRWLPVDCLDQITAHHVRKYRDEIGQKLAPGTINLAMCALNSFFRWAIEYEYIESNPAEKIKRPKVVLPPPSALSDEELDQLFAAIERVGLESWQNEYQSYEGKLHIWRRNRRAIFLSLYAGLRIGEVVALQWKHVDFSNNTILVVMGKGGKSRALPIHPVLEEELLKATNRRPDGAIVCKTDGTGISEKTAQHIFDRWLAVRGVDIHAHQLRHTFATQLMREGVPLRQIQLALGHESIETTQRYLSVSGKDLEASINRLDYRRKKGGKRS